MSESNISTTMPQTTKAAPVCAAPKPAAIADAGKKSNHQPQFFMNQAMQNLFELQSLEFDEIIQPKTEEAIAKIRAKIPKPVLAHYDRLGDRGKKGVALLNKHTCGACHMNVPVGVILDLKRGKDVCLCGSCGRYLYLPEEKNAPAKDASIIKHIIAPHQARAIAHAM